MNSQSIRNFVLFVLASAVLGVGWWYANKELFPPPPPKKPAEPPPSIGTLREARQAIVGGLAALDPTPPPSRPTSPVVAAPPKAPVEPENPYQLVALGGEGFRKRVMLTSHGAAVQQVILPDFEESTREGKESKDENGKKRPLHLLPGTTRLREKSIRQKWDYPDLQPGKVSGANLTEPSYVLLHYPVVGDPDRLPDRMPDGEGVKPDNYPSPLLGERNWKLVESVQPVAGSVARVVFEYDLNEPYNIRIRKTYTLAATDYHINLKLEFTALPGRSTERDRAKFRYQIVGAREMPLEGEWYTSTYRNAFIGWATPNGSARRTIEDAATIQTSHGGTKYEPTDGPFTYAGIGNQYFASVLCIDNEQPDEIRKNMWSYVRPTREEWSGYQQLGLEKLKKPEARFLGQETDKAFLGDISVRAVANAIDPQPGQPITHQYLIYNGPLKVRLLKQLKGDAAVSDELVERYTDKLTMKTLTDYHSPNFFGRLAHSIWWSDLVILFTNLMHSILGALNNIVPIWGVDILLLTVLVRLLLVIPSRKQQIMMANMQAKMAAMKPEIDKLAEKYKDDYQRLNQEKTKLMLQHGVNPLSSMSGCLLMFAQMPVFLGLYFCLQESIFFRLETFLWLPNLAGPDMLLWWTESIPFISDPDSLGSMTYLGPYLNVLPIIAVLLMFFHQKLSMPPPTDEQQEMQQRMMKIMMIVMGIFFYKMAAGLCLYFIASTTWGLIEKKLIPKPVAPTIGTGPAAPGGGTPPASSSASSVPGPATPPGFLGRMRARVEEMKRKAEEQSSRQIRNEPRPNGDIRKDKKKRKK